MMVKSDFGSGIVHATEKLLTLRMKRRLRAKMKQQAKHPVRDWIEAIVWAACVVLVVNQYLFQAYRIPSESMVRTLLIGDMIFVDKLSFGPELLPGVAKTGGFTVPRRGQVIIFENPSYISRGPLYTIAQQMLYMLTLTLVDIDRDENGEQRVHYLIKRAVGVPGDRLRISRGEVSLMPRGTGEWIPESELAKTSDIPFHAIRSVKAEDYRTIEGAGIEAAWKDAGLPVPLKYKGMSSGSIAYEDGFGYDSARVSAIYSMYPNDPRFAQASRRYAAGWYIPEGRIFPLGDNRDNSKDGRYFGPVSQKKVLGRALFIYFPFGRLGSVR
jgi:signal peptidase I